LASVRRGRLQAAKIASASSSRSAAVATSNHAST
jgi:hypothetical protein